MTRLNLQVFWVLAIVLPLSIVYCEERKVAPSYCLRFKLNCESEAKKKHVCCTYPLPEEGDEVQGSHFNPAGGEEGASGVKIRPIRLPQREKSEGGSDNDDSDRNSESAKRPTSFGSSNGGLSNPNNRNAPKLSTTTSAPTPSPKRPRICIRLVVNCNSSPEHRCCKSDDEEKEADEETTSEAKPDEEGDLEQDEIAEDQK